VLFGDIVDELFVSVGVLDNGSDTLMARSLSHLLDIEELITEGELLADTAQDDDVFIEEFVAFGGIA
jgi:hypothetical protein